MAEPAKQNGAKPEANIKVSVAEVEAAVEAAAKAAKLPTAEVIGKQPMTQIFQGMYWCNVCTAGMNCETALDMHLQGKKHKAKLHRVDSTMFLPHEPLGPLSKGPGMMKSNKTKKKASAGSAATAAAVEPSFKCDICDCEFNNEIPYKAHMSGKKHQKKVNAPAINSMNSRFSCALCQFVGNSPTHLEAHLQGKSHAKKAGLPPPPPGPAQAPPSAEKKKKPHRYNPYFNAREHREKKSSSYHSNSTNHSTSTYDNSYNSSSYNTSSSAYTTSGGGFTSGGYYQADSTNLSQVKPASSLTSADSANPAAYATGIVGNYGFSLYDK